MEARLQFRITGALRAIESGLRIGQLALGVVVEAPVAVHRAVAQFAHDVAWRHQSLQLGQSLRQLFGGQGRDLAAVEALEQGVERRRLRRHGRGRARAALREQQRESDELEPALTTQGGILGRRAP